MPSPHDEATDNVAEPTDVEVVDDVEVIQADLVEVEAAEPLPFDVPEDPAEANEVLTAALRQSLAQEAEFLDRWQRSAADFENLRKRSLREQQQVRSVAAERVVGAMLPTLDSFQAALDLPAETDNEKKLLAGMEATYFQLMDVLTREGLAPIPGVGAPFDPVIHDAVTHLGDGEPLVVVGELRRGYRLNDKVLRAALVAVGPATNEATE
ncbi:MAG: nucleotide exchange factor GrpE [Acidimicrobiia bacterium]|nr:nucleotide exchange factor GrpE [Acidimicrobiia bacterium]